MIMTLMSSAIQQTRSLAAKMNVKDILTMYATRSLITSKHVGTLAFEVALPKMPPECPIRELPALTFLPVKLSSEVSSKVSLKSRLPKML